MSSGSGSNFSGGAPRPERVRAYGNNERSIFDDGPDYHHPWTETILDVATEAVPYLFTGLKTCLWITLGLYILNQKHLLPKQLSAVVSKITFWPSMPITLGKRVGNFISTIDDTVVMGIAPMGFANIPELLSESYNVCGVINMCEEYKGPVSKYKRLGMKELRLPTVDHFEPSVEDLEKAVSFIEHYRSQGKKVYVHCKAGHGRSAAVVFAWLLYNDPGANRFEMNQEFCQIRNVRKTLWKQKNIVEFHSRLKRGEINIIAPKKED